METSAETNRSERSEEPDEDAVKRDDDGRAAFHSGSQQTHEDRKGSSAEDRAAEAAERELTVDDRKQQPDQVRCGGHAKHDGKERCSRA